MQGLGFCVENLHNFTINLKYLKVMTSYDTGKNRFMPS